MDEETIQNVELVTKILEFRQKLDILVKLLSNMQENHAKDLFTKITGLDANTIEKLL